MKYTVVQHTSLKIERYYLRFDKLVWSTLGGGVSGANVTSTTSTQEKKRRAVKKKKKGSVKNTLLFVC